MQPHARTHLSDKLVLWRVLLRRCVCVCEVCVQPHLSHQLVLQLCVCVCEREREREVCVQPHLSHQLVLQRVHLQQFSPAELADLELLEVLVLPLQPPLRVLLQKEPGTITTEATRHRRDSSSPGQRRAQGRCSKFTPRTDAEDDASIRCQQAATDTHNNTWLLYHRSSTRGHVAALLSLINT